MKRAVNREIDEFKKEKECNWNGRYVFIHGCDPQLGFIDAWETGGEGLKWDKEINLLQKAITAVNNMEPRPKFFFINGDLVHTYPGEGSHKIDQENDLVKTLSHSEIPVLVTSGNHDIGLTPTSDTVVNFKSRFGDDYFSFYVGGVFYIALNSQYFFDSNKCKDDADQQMIWLREQLTRTKRENMRHTVVFMHIPLFVANSDEYGGSANIPMKIRMELLNEFAGVGIEFVFSGHYHRNAGGVWETVSEDGNHRKVEVVVTSAIGQQLGDDKSGLSVVIVDENNISHKYYAMDDIPKKIF